MNTLNISALSVKTRIGLYAWEQHIEQRLLIDLSLPLNLQEEDNINLYVDYDRLCQTITRYLELNTFKLIETVAQELMKLILREFHVSPLRLTVSKPHAIANAANVSISIQS